MYFIYFGLILLFFGTMISLFFKKKIKLYLYSIFLVIASIVLLLSIFSESIIKVINPIIFIGESLEPFCLLANLDFQFNDINIFFILILSIILFCIGLYLPYYLNSYDIEKSKLNFHLFNFSFLIISITLLFTANNLLIFLILWEFMGIFSFLAIFFEGKEEGILDAAIQYLIVMHISFIFLLIGTILVYKYTSSFSFENIKNFFLINSNEGLKTVLFILFTLGFIIKLGIFPFHFWLPKAHPASPSHLSAFMSSILIKTALFGLFLILNLFGMPNLIYSKIMIFLGLISSLIGIINATSQNQIKKFLAYSSVENAGILLFFYGSLLFGYLNGNYFLYISSFLAIFIYLLNHTFSKLSAFLSAGVITNETNCDRLDYLGGIAKSFPSLAASNFLATISLAALPPFGNFIGELLILVGYTNFITNNNFSIIPFIVYFAIGLIGAITLLAFTKYFTTGFLGDFRGENKIERKKIPLAVSISLFLPIIFSFILVSPYSVSFYINNMQNNNLISSKQISNINEVIKIIYLIMSILIIIIIFFYWLYRKLNIKKSDTWACGYVPKENDNFQYSSTSFVEPFISIFRSLTGLKIKQKEENVIFNKKADIEIEHQDIINKGVLNPIIKKANDFIERITIIQSGNTQHYILYGLIFLTIIIIITLIKYL